MLKYPKKQFQFEFSRDKYFHRGFQQKVRLANDIENMPFLRSKHETTGAIRKKDRRDRGNDWYQPHYPKKSWKFRCKKCHQWERHFHPICENYNSGYMDGQSLKRVILDALSKANGWTIVDTVSSCFAKYDIEKAIIELLEKRLLLIASCDVVPEYALVAPYTFLLDNRKSKLWKTLYRTYETHLEHKGDAEYKMPNGNSWLYRSCRQFWENCPIVRAVRPSNFTNGHDDGISQDVFFASETAWKCLAHYDHHLKREFSLGLRKGVPRQFDSDTTLDFLKEIDSILQDTHSQRECMSLICKNNKMVRVDLRGRWNNR